MALYSMAPVDGPTSSIGISHHLGFGSVPSPSTWSQDSWAKRRLRFLPVISRTIPISTRRSRAAVAAIAPSSWGQRISLDEACARSRGWISGIA